MSKQLFLLAVVILCAGCSDSQKLKDAYEELEENCVGKISIELTASSFTNSVTFRCDEIKKKESK